MDVRLFSWVADARRDVIHATRLLQRHPVVTIVATVSLAIVSLTVIGSVIGLVISARISRVLAAFLFGLPPSDPITFVGVAVLFTMTALVACYWPVRRATRLDPTDALRYE